MPASDRDFETGHYTDGLNRLYIGNGFISISGDSYENGVLTVKDAEGIKIVLEISSKVT